MAAPLLKPALQACQGQLGPWAVNSDGFETSLHPIDGRIAVKHIATIGGGGFVGKQVAMCKC
eukprot:scaffold339179_cov53-Prasinocladus_malaysianus.AAC.1